LIGSAVWIGAFLAEATEGDLDAISKYGERLGLAFQILDDIDDELGGRDRDQRKATYPSIHGLAQSRAMARDLLEGARQVLAPLRTRGRLLMDFCDYLESR
jgi:geranylgeranyl diphosphate synthase type II